MKEFILGIDIGGTNFRIGAVDLEGKVSHLVKVSSDVLKKDGEMTEHLRDIIQVYLEEHELIGKLHAITIGFPSPVSKDKRIVYSCPNVQNSTGGFDGRDVVTPLSAAFGVPVFIEKDSVFLLQYDITHSRLENAGTVLGIYYGTGIGNMVYLDGKFLSGKHGVACDLGHMPFYLSDRYCTCGNRGCVECYASGRVLRDIWQESFSDVPIDDLFTAYCETTELRNFIEAMSIPVATEINIFDPDYIVLGGGILEMKDFPLDLLKKRIYEFTRKPFPGNDVTYIKASNAVDIGIIGGAFYAIKKLGLKS